MKKHEGTNTSGYQKVQVPRFANPTHASNLKRHAVTHKIDYINVDSVGRRLH